jgi:hypothetical protein
MKNDDILKRARLLAQAANDAADAAIAQAQSVDSTPPQPISSKATKPVAVSTVSLPSLNNKQEKNSSSVEKKSKSDKGKSSSKEFTNETRPPAENLQSLPAINKKINTDEKKADEELNLKLTQLHEPHPTLPVVPSPIRNDIDQTETISKESTACEDTIKESIPHSASSLVDQTKPPPILHVEDQEGDSDDPVTQYIQEYLKSREKVVVRKHAPQQVLCYLCCGEFGTASLLIHQKTCWTKQYVGSSPILPDLPLTSSPSLISSVSGHWIEFSMTKLFQSKKQRKIGKNVKFHQMVLPSHLYLQLVRIQSSLKNITKRR